MIRSIIEFCKILQGKRRSGDQCHQDCNGLGRFVKDASSTQLVSRKKRRKRRGKGGNEKNKH